MSWKKEVLPFQRGAWIRLYGIPIHAWNENFFKLCVLDCGRFLRTDNCSLNRERFDYDRVLISTSSLDVINTLDQILVDGMMVKIKIIEEWGFYLGDDVCLYDKEDKVVSETQENVDMHDDFENIEKVEIIAEKIVQDLEAADDIQGVDMNVAGKAIVETTDPIEVLDNYHPDGGSDSPLIAKQTTEVPTISETSVYKEDSCMEQDKQETMGTEPNEVELGTGGLVPIAEVQATSNEVGLKRKKGRNNSTCTLGNSGPWSVDWLQNSHQGDICNALFYLFNYLG